MKCSTRSSGRTPDAWIRLRGGAAILAAAALRRYARSAHPSGGAQDFARPVPVYRQQPAAKSDQFRKAALQFVRNLILMPVATHREHASVADCFPSSEALSANATATLIADTTTAVNW